MSFDKKAHLASLKESGWTDTELAAIENLSVEVLAKIEPKKSPTANNQKVPDPTPTPEPKPETKPEPAKAPTFGELLANADPATREALEEAQEVMTTQRAAFVKQIKANGAGIEFNDEYLSKKSFKELRMLAALATGGKKKEQSQEDFRLPALFIGNAGGSEEELLANAAGGSEEEPLVSKNMFLVNKTEGGNKATA